VPDTIPGRLAEVRARIARAASRAGRDPSSVRLVAVSKTFSADHVRAAAAAGQIDFGENKVQEALAKMDALADLPLRWHLIGHLQSNKAKRAGSRFDVVQSVDSVALLKKIDEGAAAENRTVDLFVRWISPGKRRNSERGRPNSPRSSRRRSRLPMCASLD
jgi:uncharacterized pyridoxal phosphate-containing UPF0001 family protein